MSCAPTPSSRIPNRTDLLSLEIDILNIVIFLAFSVRPIAFVTVNFYDKARSFQNSNLQKLAWAGYPKFESETTKEMTFSFYKMKCTGCVALFYVNYLEEQYL